MQSVRKDLINILNCAAESKDFPSTSNKKDKSKQIQLISELINNGYLNGSSENNAEGIPALVYVTGITIKGREYVEKLEAEFFSKSLKGRFTSILTKGGWVGLGIGVTLLSQWLSKILKLN